MAHEQQAKCMHCAHLFRVCIPLEDMFPPKADSRYEVDCPECGRISNFIPAAGIQRTDCDGTLPIAREAAQ